MFSNRRLGALGAGFLIATFGTLIFWHYRQQAAEAVTAPAKVAVLPFDNQTGDDANDPIARAAAGVLARQLHGLPRTQAFVASSAPEARAQGATHIVMGQVTKSKNKLVLAYTVQDKDRKNIGGGQVPGQGGKWLKSLDTLATTVAATFRAPAAKPAPLEINAETALQAFGEGDMEAAVAADPDCGWCWVQLAQSKARASEAKAVQEVIERSGQAKISATSRAQLQMMEAQLSNDPAMKLKAVAVLAAQRPDDAAIQAEYAQGLTSAHEYEAATKAWNRALRIDPYRGEWWNLLGYTLAYMGQFEQAQRALAEYARLEPNSPNPADSQGEVAMAAGQFAAAEKWFRESAAKDPNFNGSAALEKAALVLYLAGDRRQAGEAVERFLAARAKASDPLQPYHRARWALLFGQEAEAVKMWQALASRPNAATVLSVVRLALLDLLNEKKPEAQAAFLKVRGLARSSADAYAVLSLYAVLNAQARGEMKNAGERATMDALAATFSGDVASASPSWATAAKSSVPGGDDFPIEMEAWCEVRMKRPEAAGKLLGARWPLLNQQQWLLMDFLVYPNLFFVRAEAAEAGKKAAEARRLYDLYLLYSAGSTDRFGQQAIAKKNARL